MGIGCDYLIPELCVFIPSDLAILLRNVLKYLSGISTWCLEKLIIIAAYIYPVFTVYQALYEGQILTHLFSITF